MKAVLAAKLVSSAFLGALTRKHLFVHDGFSPLGVQRVHTRRDTVRNDHYAPRRRPSKMFMVHETLAEVTPALLAQLAGCAVLVGTGKVFQQKEEEEGIEPVAPWAPKDGMETKDIDLYRDTAVRYFGYANEVGEAFRPVVPTILVTFSYTVAFVYILADSYSQGTKVADPISGVWKKPSFLAGVDSLLFQIMASVIFPSFAINRWVTFLGAALTYLPEGELPVQVLDYFPTATGLLLIPVICGPLDILTHRILDNSFRSVSETILRKERFLE